MTDPIPPEGSPPVEQDDRFPSGPWRGFYLQANLPGRQWMDLILTFRAGVIQGEGHDRIGDFLVRGRYAVEDGKCRWSKRYVGKHDVYYQGYNEGKGIWGTWEIPPSWRGGFHIWPVGMADPTGGALTEALELPREAEDAETVEEERPTEELVPVGEPVGPAGVLG